jgi:selenocysteine lyase/cysteine desulfurase
VSAPDAPGATRTAACARLAELTNTQPEGVAFDRDVEALRARVGATIAATLDRGHEIIVVVHAGHRPADTWTALAAEHGLLVREAAVAPGASEKQFVASVREHISTRTRVIVFDLGSTERAYAPARALARLAHQEGALVWADGTDLLAERRFDRQREWVDVLFVDLAQMGVGDLGAVAMRPDLARDLPLPEGGTDDHNGEYGRRFDAPALSWT